MGRHKRALVWVERRAAEPGERSSWHLMDGRRVVTTVSPQARGWWWYGFGHSGRRLDELSLEDAKAEAERRAMMDVPGRSIFGSDDDDQGLP